jgi:cytochrome subunit of sulfide dehydrogenase
VALLAQGRSEALRGWLTLGRGRFLDIGIAAVLAFLGTQAGAAEDAEGAQIAATCASCHDPNGSDHGIPPIVGLDEKRTIDAILAYRASETPSHVMHAIALALSDEELASVVRYLAAHGKDAPP